MKRIGILGSRKLSCKILKWISKQDNTNIVGVVPPPFKGWWNDNLKTTAKSLNLKVCNDIDHLIQQKPDIIFSINYWKKVPKDYISLIKDGIINIHHSYLLKYRGRYSTSWAIINSKKDNNFIHGTTLHYITPELDNGPIISSYKCDITDEDTAETLFLKVEKLAFKMFKNNFSKILNNNITSFLPPDPKFYYYDKDSNNNLEISSEFNLEEVYDFVRAWSFRDRPQPYFKFNNKKLIVSLENEE